MSSDMLPNSAIIATSPQTRRHVPTAVVVIGMAGSGKTTLLHRLNLHLLDQNQRGYYVNLDPAVQDVPFGANIDIRDTVQYKEVMSQYGLGPNGAILTSLNLFATRFDQVIRILEQRAGLTKRPESSSTVENMNSEENVTEETLQEAAEEDGLDYIIIDTPGQIETFTWSAGGQIILDLLATSFPTVVLYVTDTPRCISPTTFMNNMLYASSVLYKSQLPMIAVFNKIDAQPFEFARQWMTDFEAFQDALDAGSRSEEYLGSLNRSLSLAMDEFYSQIRAVGVSAATAEGIPDLFAALDDARFEFEETYLPDLIQRISLREAEEERKRAVDLKRLQEDLLSTRGDRLVFAPEEKLEHDDRGEDDEE